MNEGKLAGELIRQTVRDQIRGKNPPEAEKTYRRLRAQGYSDKDAIELIAAVLAAEMYYILNEQREHDPVKYAAMLQRLPELPHDSDA
jgi:UDP-glucose 4-epimerase